MVCVTSGRVRVLVVTAMVLGMGWMVYHGLKTVGTGEVNLRTASRQHNGSGHTNRLIHEASPYLLQHADNPVDWYPWGQEAFEKARKEDKPIFLSIGYSTCHWCHVMEHESFEDEEVARLMNEVFVSIKVDREERPDIDGIYMAVCQTMTGSGGWPLTIIMTADKKPFFAGTYIPKASRFGRMGMLELIPRISELWTDKRSDLLALADRVTATLEVSPTQVDRELGETALKSAYQRLASTFDGHHGGFGAAPKFPTPHNFFFLLRYAKRTGDTHALHMVEKTLEAMRLGGICDHIGFGFHRYSTDRQWLVPHFEKMLYDQALLAMAYIEVYQATGQRTYADTAREIFSYVLRDMTSPGGVFYSAEDADSEGQEGKFYLWTEDEIRRVLSEEDAELAIATFNIDKAGNFDDPHRGGVTGENILHLVERPDHTTAARVESIRAKLFAVREKRVHPGKDDKILTDWNGLMIAALAKGARALDDRRYAKAAADAADFIFERLRSAEGRLLHRFRDGQAGISAHVDDYAFLVWGLIELYEATFDVRYLRDALTLNDAMLEHFWDDERGGLHFTADDAEALLVRQKPSYDGAVPSGNSVAMLNLLRLGRFTGRSDLEARASEMAGTFSNDVARLPSAYTQLLTAVDFGLGPSYEITIAGGLEAGDTQAMLRALRTNFVPNKIVVLHPTGRHASDIVKLAPFVEYQTSTNGRATAYVCQNYTCKRPTTEPVQMLELLGVGSVR